VATKKKVQKKKRLLLYNANLYKIGGIETFIKNFVKRMKNHYDILYVYESADGAQLAKIAEHVPVVQYINQKFDTDICLWVSAWGKQPEKAISAQVYAQMIHADYEKAYKNSGFKYMKLPKTTVHLAVSRESAEAFTRMYGYKCSYIYNLLNDEPDETRVLNLITVSRMGKEKGFDRIVTAAHKMKDEGYKFLWLIFGDIPDGAYKNKIIYALKNIPEVIFMPTRLDILPFVKNADYLVQLSDTEAFCYSIYEALQMRTPCIVTNFPSAHEVVRDGVNGYILEMDLSNLDLEKIFNEIPVITDFQELASEKDWIEIFKDITPKEEYDDSSLSAYKASLSQPANIEEYKQGGDSLVEITGIYYDSILGRYTKSGERIFMHPDRAELVCSKGYGRKI
jgi:glycosyltransferase involved in cell wall biosynthesis